MKILQLSAVGWATVVGGIALGTATGIAASYALQSNFVLRASGAVLVIDQPTREFDLTAEADTVRATFDITNVTDRPITIYGAETHCGCATLAEMPRKIDAGQKAALDFIVDIRGAQPREEIVRTARLFVDRPSPLLMLTMKVRVSPAGSKDP